MATRFRFADVTQGTTIDLLGGTLELEDGSWTTRSAAPEGDIVAGQYGAVPVFQQYGIVNEQFSLIGEDTRANLITAINTLEAVLPEGTRLYHANPLHGTSYWLEANVDGESVRRILLLRGGMQYPTDIGIGPLMENAIARVQVAFDRHPLWENVAVGNQSLANLSCSGGKWVLTSGGKIPGRIHKLQLDGRSGAGGPIVRFWAGIRPTYQGTTNFNPVWECESGDAYTDTSSVVDATASNGNKMQCTFATTETMTKRVALSVVTFLGAATAKEYVGRYLILVRAKVSAGTVGVRVSSGMSSGSSFAPRETVYIDNTSWRIVELGEVQIPPFPYQSQIQADATVLYYQMQLAAERVSGAGNLDLDCIYLMPSEHFCYVEGMGVQYEAEGDNPAKIFTFENDENLALWYNSIPSYEIPDAADVGDFVDWYMPVAGGVLVLVGERESSHVLTDAVDANVDIFHRWLSYRGS